MFLFLEDLKQVKTDKKKISNPLNLLISYCKRKWRNLFKIYRTLHNPEILFLIERKGKLFNVKIAQINEELDWGTFLWPESRSLLTLENHNSNINVARPSNNLRKGKSAVSLKRNFTKNLEGWWCDHLKANPA